MSKKYVTEQDDAYVEKLNELLELMPDYIRDYFIAIDMSTNDRTRVAYCRDIFVFFRYLVDNNAKCKQYTIKDLPIAIFDELVSDDITYFLNHLKKYKVDDKEYRNSDSTRARYLSSISGMYTYFNRTKHIKNNPTVAINRPKRKKKPVIALDQDEIFILMDAIDDTANMTDRQRKMHEKIVDRNRAIISLFLGTGLRISELVALDIGDVNLKNNSLFVIRKGGDEEFVFFGDEVKQALCLYLYGTDQVVDFNEEEIRAMSPRERLIGKNDDEPALFISNHSKRMGVRSIEIMLNKYCQKINLNKKITPHKLRSTYGTTLYSETTDLVLVARLLNHRDMNVSKDRYISDSEKPRREAAQLIKLKKET